MRIFAFVLTLLLFLAVNSEAGWMDNVKSRAQGVLNRKIDETQREVENSIEDSIRGQATDNQDNSQKNQKTSSSIKDEDKLDLYGGHSAPWNVAAEGSTKVQDVVIKGMRLGMPEVLIDEILTKEGFEKTGYSQYSKEIIEINGEQKEVTRSQQKGKSVEEKGKLIKRYIIQYATVAVDDELLKEFDEPLQELIKEGKKKLKELKDKNQEIQNARQNSREKGSRPQYDQYPVDTSAFKLVYQFEYTQTFAHNNQYDQNALMSQIQGIFGEPTYAPESVHARDGSAFGTNEKNWYIYHDAALVPIEQREDLLKKIDKKPDRWSMKNAFSHPCGASPNSVMNCVASPLSVAYAGDLETKLKAARIIYAPVMMVHFQSPFIKTTLAWEYIKSAQSIREYFNKTNAYKSMPKAKVDF